MKVALLVPGIMATRMELDGKEIWPPTPFETKFGYKRIKELQSERAKPTELIFNVLCFQFYSTIRDRLADAGYRPNDPEKRYVDFPYDWRQDLFDTVDGLAERIGELHDAGATKIALLGHSMGGLLCRLLLESGKFDGESWFGKIDMFVALAVPHLGAPLAIARIFGVDSTLGISGKDFAELASNRKYPSGYQLITAPGEQPVWDLASKTLAPLDPYDNATAAKLGLDPVLVARAQAVHDVLGQHRKPAGVRYFYFAGTGHKTATRINVELGNGSSVDHSKTVVTRTPDGGDGTVPIYSALPQLGQRQIVVNEHSTVFEGRPFKRVFTRLFGVDTGAPVETDSTIADPSLSLSVDSPVQTVGAPIETHIALSPTSVANAPVKIEGMLVLDLVNEEGKRETRGFRETPVSYDGPGIEGLTVHLPPVDEPGLFVLRFAGNLPAENDVRFAVSEA